MENQQQHFQCVICLDLAYKPVVQSCGHILCFWCTHKAMDSKKPSSQCPTCRRKYTRFPRVCALLDRFLGLAFPRDYLARARETQEMEERLQVFSPRTEYKLGMRLHMRQTSTQLDRQCNAHRECMLTLYTGDELSTEWMDYSSDKVHQDHKHGDNRCSGDSESTMLINCLDYVTKDKVADIYPSPHDFPCAICHELLYRPIVLNSGEGRGSGYRCSMEQERWWLTVTPFSEKALCEPCVKNQNLLTHINRVSYAECVNSNASAHVCLELHHYLEARFPLQYQQRKRKASDYFIDNAFEDTKPLPSLDDGLMMEDKYDYIHEGVGCDGCGMYPIVGRRYRCKECPEKVGYDLCGHCEKSKCNSGRFNQKHQIHHELEEVMPNHSSSNQVRLARIGYTNMAPLFILNLRQSVLHQHMQTQDSPQILPADFDDYISDLV